MKIKIKRIDKEVELPKHSRSGDAAIDIRSAESLILKPDERRAIKSGIAIELPEGYAGFVWDRSGIAALHGIHTMAGVLDSNYRGELVIVLKNLSNQDFEIKKNDRIAQLAIQKVETVEVEEADELSETNRGEGKFGSSGTR